jgi:hypothetical protein
MITICHTLGVLALVKGLQRQKPLVSIFFAFRAQIVVLACPCFRSAKNTKKLSFARLERGLALGQGTGVWAFALLR